MNFVDSAKILLVSRILSLHEELTVISRQITVSVRIVLLVELNDVV